MASRNPILSGSGSMLGIVEDPAEAWPLLWGKHKWAVSLLGQVQLSFSSCCHGPAQVFLDILISCILHRTRGGHGKARPMVKFENDLSHSSMPHELRSLIPFFCFLSFSHR